MATLTNCHVACLATEGFEQAELLEPVKALREAGAVVDVISSERGTVQGFKHHDKGESVEANLAFAEASPERYDGLLLPGGVINGDQIRVIPEAQRFVRAFADAKKPMAVICHAPWILVNTGVARGRTLTSWPTLQEDLRNAGATWVDREVCVDGNLVTSRKPDDIPAFNREFIRLLGERPGESPSASQAERSTMAR